MIKQTLDQDIKSAMLAGDKRTANALRNVKAAILAAEVASGKREEGLTDAETISLLQKEQKKRAEAVALFDQGGNSESAGEERFEEELIQKYLPEQLSEDDINKLIDEAVNELPEGQRNMGQIIGSVKQKSSGAADGAVIAKLVKERLN